MNIEWQEILNRFLQSFKIGLTFREKEALIFKRDLSLKKKLKEQNDLILPIYKQIEHWQKANKQMSWGIQEDEFDHIGDSFEITEKDKKDGFISIILSYGFGEDGLGNSDAILSGKRAWEYAKKSKKKKTWKCEYFDFDKPEHIRLRPKASPRPKGFYYAKFQTGERYQNLKVSQLLKRLSGDTACGPEGIQFLTITHTHFADLMNERKIPFMVFADYDIAPHGYSDFFDAMQMFCSNGILGLGIGNVDFNYPFFGIPTLRFTTKMKVELPNQSD
ncbi:MAG: hypothetical protein JSW04_00125 [Desulfobacterales bacterium]|nr:MAG: hypothetical protein JSW04_00125 [Desulfobacterales bacterium]